MRISFFGKLGETIGREIEVDCPAGCSIAELRARLSELYPVAEADLVSPRLRTCVDDAIVSEQFRLPEHASVEFFPPLSGG